VAGDELSPRKFWDFLKSEVHATVEVGSIGQDAGVSAVVMHQAELT
jgi:hypothetical protein